MVRPRLALVALVLLAVAATAAAEGDPLPSWRAGPVKSALLDFVRRVTTAGGAEYVPPAERIATFDNDGTLWAEQPAYVQLAFALDRVRALAPRHPEWKDTPPFRAVLEGDPSALAAGGDRGLTEVLATTHAGMTTDEFEAIVRQWLGRARHPRFQRPYTELVYQPMLEVLAHLRASGFKTYVVSGGGVEFMRPWTERVYGIPPEQVIGSRIETRLETRDGRPVLRRLPAVAFVDDRAGKVQGIHAHIGRRPIAAFGNSDGDLEMLQWTAAGPGARLLLLVHHTDAEREWAYDRASTIGRLDRALDEAHARGWLVADMKRDWARVFAGPAP
jgi:phosphoserine phosphatase